MASVESVFPGQAATFEALFVNADNSPFVGISAPTWQVRDPDNKLVVQGAGSQDSLNPARWTASITLPASAPPTASGRRYQINWVVRSASGEVQRQKDFFAVRANQDFDFVELDRLLLEKSVLIDSLAVPADLDTIEQLQVRLLTESNSVIYDSGVLTGVNIPTPVLNIDYNVYTFESAEPVTAMVVDPAGSKPYLIEWVYVVNGFAEREYHFAYVVNNKLMILSRQLRAMIDKARNQHPNPALQYSDVDLIEYINQGTQYVNLVKPTLTDWTPSNFPDVFRQSILYAAAYCALSAQYLAEGQAAFDFSGQAVSLNVDRTQYIDAALGRIIDFLQNQLPTAKRMYIRSTGMTGHAAGVLGVNVGVSLGWTSVGLRYDRYRRFFASGL